MKYSKRGGYCLVPDPLTWEPDVTDELAVGVTAELAAGVTDDPAVILAGVTAELAAGVTNDPAVILAGVTAELAAGVTNDPAEILAGVTDEFVTFWLTDGVTGNRKAAGMGTICGPPVSEPLLEVEQLTP